MQKTKGKRLAFEMLFALALFLLLIAILVTELSRASEAYFYEQAELTTYTQTDTLTGYIFREEVAPTTLNSGPIHYQAANGTAVQAGDVLASVHEDDENKDKRERAAAIYAQIAELEAALAATEDWKSTYVSSYTELMCELSAGRTGSALPALQDTATALGGREAEAQATADAIRARIAELQAELDALIADLPPAFTTTAAADGIFYHSADGYEALFGTNQVANLTPASLSALLAAEPKLQGVIGKLVCSGTWYLAVPLEKALAQTYTINTPYPVRFDTGNTVMTLERIYTDDTDNALLIFRGEESSTDLCGRKQTVRVEKARVSGLAIPADALDADNTIFVLQDGVARLRRVTPVLCEQGCVLVLPDEENGLAAGERVIVSAKQLFDGKVLQ